MLRATARRPHPELAPMLDATENAAESALRRARVPLAEDLPGPDRESAPLPDSPQEPV
jgi:RNA polymerase sigma-70 factor (ECF subfamily)